MEQHCTSYLVWRRSDGYVDASGRSRQPAATMDERPWTDGQWTFTPLLETASWPEARARIAAERAAG